MTDKEKILKWCEEVSYKSEENLFIQKLRDKGFNDSQIVSIIETVSEVCINCFDNITHCMCENDE